MALEMRSDNARDDTSVESEGLLSVFASFLVRNFAELICHERRAYVLRGSLTFNQLPKKKPPFPSKKLAHFHGSKADASVSDTSIIRSNSQRGEN